MSIVPEMSDEGIARQFGDIVNELPELFEALRLWEMQNRPMSMSGGFKMKSDWVSVERGGDMLRLQIGNPRGKE